MEPKPCPHCGAPMVDEDDAGDCGWAPGFIRNPMTGGVKKPVDDELAKLAEQLPEGRK